MLKFFRKHNKKLLAIFMALLMIVFIGGSALQNLLTPRSDRVVAESALGDVGLVDQQQATASTQILERMGVNWEEPFGPTENPLALVDWILLTREARQFGVFPSPTAVKVWTHSQLGSEGVNRLSRLLRVKPSRILSAFGELVSVRITGQAIANAAAPSASEVRTLASQVLDEVLVNAVVLPAKAFADEDAEFSEAEIEAQWAAYRDREPGRGLNFGYYVPPAVKVQYVKVDRDAVAESVGIANLARKARQYYDENLETEPRFRRPPDLVRLAEQGLEGPPPPPQLAWEEAQDVATDIVRERRANEVSEQIATWLIEQAGMKWLSAERGDDRYKQPPPDAADLSYYETLTDALPSTIAYRDAISVSLTDFFSESEAVTVPEIGQAAYRAPGGESFSIRKLAFQTKGIVPTIPDDAGSDAANYLAPYQTSQFPLKDFAGSFYVFRVVETNPGHAAESVDEVRDRVVADLRLLHGYETALARAEGLRSCATDRSLRESYESDDDLVALKNTPEGRESGFFKPSLVSRLSLSRALGGSTSTTTYVPNGVGAVPTEVIDQWFDLEYVDEKTTVVELKDRATVLVAEWVETQPATDTEFEEIKGKLASGLSSRRVRDALNDWLHPEQIRARNGFEFVGR